MHDKEREEMPLNKAIIGCKTCAKDRDGRCNANLDYPICLSTGECKYIGPKEDGFNYSEFEPAEEFVQLFPMQNTKWEHGFYAKKG